MWRANLEYKACQSYKSKRIIAQASNLWNLIWFDLLWSSFWQMNDLLLVKTTISTMRPALKKLNTRPILLFAQRIHDWDQHEQFSVTTMRTCTTKLFRQSSLKTQISRYWVPYCWKLGYLGFVHLMDSIGQGASCLEQTYNLSVFIWWFNTSKIFYVRQLPQP